MVAFSMLVTFVDIIISFTSEFASVAGMNVVNPAAPSSCENGQWG